MNAIFRELTESAIERGNELLVRRKLEEKISVLEEFNRLLVEATGDCILIVDAQGRVLSINSVGRELFEANSAEPDTRHWTTLFREVDGQIDPRQFPAPQPGKTFRAISRVRSGETKFWNIAFTRFAPTDPEGRFVLIARDVTEHMMAERALRQSEQAFRKVFEENPIGMMIVGLNYRAQRINNAFSAMLGYSEAELIDKDVRPWFPVAHAENADLLVRLLAGEITSFHRELTLQTKRGQPVWSHLTVSVLRDAENQPSALLHIVENIQDRKSAEEQVLAYQSQLQSLASEAALSEERERRRIATDLHDLVGQSLAFARLKLASADPQTSPLVQEIRAVLDQAIADTRSLTFELSPPVLYELGLVAAIEWLARKMQQEHAIETRFHDDGQPKPLNDNLRIVLFQTVRELFANIAKHARASHAQVLLRRDADALRIVIEDDGVGFELSKVTSNREATKSFGLFNVRERVEYLGGRVKIRSEPGHGTRVTLIAPLKLEAGGKN